MDISNLPGTQQNKLKRWQSYVDDALLKTEQVTEAAIYGLDGVKWAASKDFTISSSEVSRLVTCLTTGDSAALRKSGIKVAGQNYIFLRCEEGRSIYGRKGANAGVCIVKSKQALLIGVYGPGIQPGNCNTVMEKLADYLIQREI